MTKSVMSAGAVAKMQAELDAARAENARLKEAKKSSLTLKVSQKGAVSLYGMGRFPTTLYKQQWEQVFAISKDIKAFIKENDAELTVK